MRNLIIFLLLLYSSSVAAQNFEDYFENNTLRLDYIFSGAFDREIVSINKLNKLPEWVGKRKNLSDLARAGNGQIIVRDVSTNAVIYKESFSSLFQEWQFVEEAKLVDRSFENVFLIPFPLKEINVQVLLISKDGNYQELFNHRVNPKDILIHKPQYKMPYSEIHRGGDIEKSINIAIVPEGYTIHEMDKFKEHAKTAVKAIFGHKPFGSYKDRFNFFAVDAYSSESGVSVPRKNIWKKTLVSSHFDTFYSDRYLTTSNVFDLHDALVGVPYSHIIILANSDTYGGGGIFNSYTLTTTGHKDFEPVVVHEFGHSFVGLADEYFYENGDIFETMYSFEVEPWEPNITTLVDFESKWKELLPQATSIPTVIGNKVPDESTIGVFEGGGYVSKGIYSPAPDCRMKTNVCKYFCPACQSAIENIIQFYTE